MIVRIRCCFDEAPSSTCLMWEKIYPESQPPRVHKKEGVILKEDLADLSIFDRLFSQRKCFVWLKPEGSYEERMDAMRELGRSLRSLPNPDDHHHLLHSVDPSRRAPGSFAYLATSPGFPRPPNVSVVSVLRLA